MARFKLTIEYEGTRYSGWQIQRGGKSIQGEIMDACKDLFGTIKIDLMGAGRTDAGVHASGQVAHLGVDTDMTCLRVKYGINDRLPPDICIIDTEEAYPDFNARHDAVARSYIYLISRRRTAFGKKFVWWIKDRLDVERMREAAEHFNGLKNFRSFTDPDQEQGSTKVEIISNAIKEYDDLIMYHITGSHFLWKQVRRMTGVLAEVGRGKMSPAEVASLLRIKSDLPAKFTAPPSGLFLDRVYYKRQDIVTDVMPIIRL
ncbi:MAG: tRNA pseudouridine(38-40) synthase TruA [Bacteroidales bacterium]|jgi:tRNA pseudouridine38-40 synthase|nr:tRNA pseudouridine(38-40) synthase TruA [Bacteroidales bacterium]